MGFEEVALIGMDFSYTVPEDSQIDGAHILSMGDDPNHFHPDYFGKGKIWKDPKLDRVLANYQLAKLMYEADGRRIVNRRRAENSSCSIESPTTSCSARPSPLGQRPCTGSRRPQLGRSI